MNQASGLAAVADRWPSGAVIVVWRQGSEVEFLLLRRAGNGSLFTGDWVWGPPSGVLEPGESIEECAARELFEETGLTSSLRRIEAPSDRWPVFVAEARKDAEIRLSAEHDQFAWLTLARAAARTKPALVRNQLLTAGRHVRGRNRPAPVSSPDEATPPSDR